MLNVLSWAAGKAGDGWLDVVSPSNYCERRHAIDPLAFDAEPWNALTNIAFFLSAIFAWNMLRLNPDAQPRRQLQVLIAILFLVGVGSMLFHTLGTKWANLGDVIPIGAYVLLFLWIFMTQFFGLPLLMKAVALAVVLGAVLYCEYGLPPDTLGGGALYVPIFAAVLIAAASLYWNNPNAGRLMLIATTVWMISLIVRQVDAFVCNDLSAPEYIKALLAHGQALHEGEAQMRAYETASPFHIGTHFVWHITNALVLFLFASVVIQYGPKHAAGAEAK